MYCICIWSSFVFNKRKYNEDYTGKFRSWYLNLKVVKWLIFVDDKICWWVFFLLLKKNEKRNNFIISRLAFTFTNATCLWSRVLFRIVVLEIKRLHDCNCGGGNKTTRTWKIPKTLQREPGFIHKKLWEVFRPAGGHNNINNTLTLKSTEW